MDVVQPGLYWPLPDKILREFRGMCLLYGTALVLSEPPLDHTECWHFASTARTTKSITSQNLSSLGSDFRWKTADTFDALRLRFKPISEIGGSLHARASKATGPITTNGHAIHDRQDRSAALNFLSFRFMAVSISGKKVLSFTENRCLPPQNASWLQSGATISLGLDCAVEKVENCAVCTNTRGFTSRFMSLYGISCTHITSQPSDPERKNTVGVVVSAQDRMTIEIPSRWAILSEKHCSRYQLERRSHLHTIEGKRTRMIYFFARMERCRRINVYETKYQNSTRRQ